MAITSLVPTITPTVSESKTANAMAVEKSLDITKAVITHPFYSIILGCALVEYLQTIMIDDPSNMQWQKQPGTHALYYGPMRKPLISSGLGNTLETVTFIQSAVKDLGGLAQIAALFKLGL